MVSTRSSVRNAQKIVAIFLDGSHDIFARVPVFFSRVGFLLRVSWENRCALFPRGPGVDPGVLWRPGVQWGPQGLVWPHGAQGPSSLEALEPKGPIGPMVMPVSPLISVKLLTHWS